MKYGRRPARHTLRTFRRGLVMARALDALGPAPSISDDYTTLVEVPWGMFLNDQLGDCVCADTAHMLMLRTANASQIVVPSDQDVLALYEAVGGYKPGDSSTDQGCDETSMCQYLEDTGFLGHKSAGTGMVDPKDLDHVKWCVQLFGGCRLGLNMPGYAMSQFNAGQPWDVDASADQTIEGGHDVPLVRYDRDYFYVITWGGLQRVTPAFFGAFCEEAHGEVYGDWIKACGTAPSGFGLDALISDLSAIRE